MAVTTTMMTMRENVGGNCVRLWNYIQYLSLGIFRFGDIQDWDTNKNLWAHGDPLNLQCTLFKRKWMICIFLHLLALPKVTKTLMQSVQQCAHIWKVSFSALPPWITSSWTVRGKAWGRSPLNLSPEIPSCPIQAQWLLSKDEMNVLLSSIAPEILPRTLWDCLKWPLSHGRMKKRKRTKNMP